MCFSFAPRASPADFHPMNRDQSNFVATQDLFLFDGNSRLKLVLICYQHATSDFFILEPINNKSGVWLNEQLNQIENDALTQTLLITTIFP